MQLKLRARMPTSRMRSLDHPILDQLNSESKINVFLEFAENNPQKWNTGIQF